MDITKNIKRTNEYDNEVRSIEEVCRRAKKIVKERYEEEPCHHNIIVKFYGSLYSYNYDKPNYVCLGCNKKLEEDIDFQDKNIIDLTDKFWPDNISSVDGLTNNYLIMLYLQELAFEAESKIPNFTDEDFYEMIRCNTAYVNVPKDYHPKRNNVDTD